MHVRERTRVIFTKREMSYKEEIDYLRTALRRMTEKSLSAWDAGFAAAVAMANAGATPERLAEASGIVEMIGEDTIPVLMEYDTTQVNVVLS